ncbi:MULTISPECIES: hypothetical protein [unclassified Campylobacter]|uniref:hypothetical protein n=1 Tax=unclassified Campylobacter TaxID=2593542 RepID=UPI0022E9C9EE|nr:MULTISPECIES: hypothetical protein [unclassified Campylobacter]MDA3062016.1 hypothetical protein [Campylobacter sp. JMF_14 EL1]MDA3072879.1 hypothetical protein [Campylobacter sp. JMF_10 EL2]
MNSKLLGLSLMINPILSIFTSILLKIDIKKHYIFIAIFFGYIAMLLEPSQSVAFIKSDDIMRHYERYEGYNSYDLGLDFFSYLKETSNYNKDLFIPFVYYIGNLLNLKKEILPFISVFISFFCILKIFYILFNNKKVINLNFLFLIIILFIDFRAAALGIRYYPAICLITYGLFSYFYESRYKKAFFLILFANIMHIATFTFTMIFICFIFIKKIIKQKYFYLLFYLTIIILFIPNLSTSVFYIISPLLHLDLSAYTDGYWAKEFISDLSISGLMYFFMFKYTNLLFIFFTIIYLKNRVKQVNLYNFLILTCFLTSFFHEFGSMFSKFLQFWFLCSIILWLIYFSENKIKKNILYIIFSITFILFISNVYTMRYFINETLIKLIFPTIYNILFDSIPYENFLYNDATGGIV